MACMHSVAASVFTLISAGYALAAAITEDLLPRAIVRRHRPQDATLVHIPAAGGLSLIHRQDPSPTFCDHDYFLGTPNTNSCSKGVPISHPQDCIHAANALSNSGLTAAATANFTSDDGWQNPLPYPKNCFTLDGLVHYNPTQTTPTTWTGTPICERELYPAANNVTDASGYGTCSADFEAITDMAACAKAFSCVEGNNGCQMPEFEDKAIYISQDRPTGCFREPNGCFNFNHITSKPNGTVISGHTVCKLKAV